MELFTLIDDGVAIIRKPPGVFMQTKLYHRGGDVYINAAGGFVRICAKFDTYGTTHPNIKVLELSGRNVVLHQKNAPAYRQGWGK